MAKKRKKRADRENTAADYYKLKTQAVDDLVTADSSNSPPVSKAELERYGARKKNGIPNWVKVCFIKFWFPGSVCYFMVMGLGLYVPLDLIVIVGIVLGMVTDLLTNNMLRFIAETDGANDSWLMFPKKGYSSFVFNIAYSALLVAIVVLLYAGWELVANLVMGTDGVEYLKMGPVSFGLFYMLSDNALVALKNWIKKLFHSRKNKNV